MLTISVAVTGGCGPMTAYRGFILYIYVDKSPVNDGKIQGCTKIISKYIIKDVDA